MSPPSTGAVAKKYSSLFVESIMMIGREWSSATVPAGAKFHPAVGDQESTPTSGSVTGSDGSSPADVLTAAKIRPPSPTSCLMLMWSSEKFGPSEKLVNDQ